MHLSLDETNPKPEGDFPVTRILACLMFAAFLFAPAIRAQAGPEQGGHELQLWTGGGHGLNGSTADSGVWNVGARYGWILTVPHGPGFLRGQFEYAVDVVPLFMVVQRNGNAYGFGLNPFALKWNFTKPRRVVPYFELGGGTLFTNTDVPPALRASTSLPAARWACISSRAGTTGASSFASCIFPTPALPAPTPGLIRSSFAWALADSRGRTSAHNSRAV